MIRELRARGLRTVEIGTDSVFDSDEAATVHACQAHGDHPVEVLAGLEVERGPARQVARVAEVVLLLECVGHHPTHGRRDHTPYGGDREHPFPAAERNHRANR